MDKISRENQAILHRIQTVRPQYSTRKWEGDFEVHRTRTKALSLFPPIETVCNLDYNEASLIHTLCIGHQNTLCT